MSPGARAILRTLAVLASLDSLREAFPFGVVALEGQDHDFSSLRRDGGPPDPLVTSAESTLVMVSPAFRDWALDALRRWKTPGVSELQRKYVDGHRDLAIGLEGRGVTNLLRLVFHAIYVAVLDDRLQALADPSRPFDPAAPLHRERMRGIAVLDSVLAASDPTHTRWPASFAWDSTAGPRLSEIDARESYQLRYAMLIVRNQIFSRVIPFELDRRRGSAAVAIVGVAHCQRSDLGPSLPEMLHARGATVVVADPPAVCRYRTEHPEEARALQ